MPDTNPQNQPHDEMQRTIKTTVTAPKSPYLEVARDDLRIVTSAVLGGWIEHYTCGSGREVTICRFCNREQIYDYSKYEVTEPDHAPDCAVLVATSIMPAPKHRQTHQH